MNTTLLINILGLLVDIVGALLIFLNSPEYDIPGAVLWSETELVEHKLIINKKRKLAKIGMLLLVIGFTIQLTSNILSF